MLIVLTFNLEDDINEKTTVIIFRIIYDKYINIRLFYFPSLIIISEEAISIDESL